MMTTINTPILRIPLDNYRKLMAYVDLCEGEVTGFFDVEWDRELGLFILGEIYLIKQEAGAADVEMDEDDIATFMEELIAKGVTQLPRGWWHSHVNMGAFFSGTDNNTINNDFINDSFTLSLVVNKKREMKASVVIFEDLPYDLVLAPIRIDDLRVEVEWGYTSIPEELRKEVAEKVQPHKPVYQYQGNLNYGGRKKNKEGKSLSLPKDKTEALQKIEALDLIRQFDPDLREAVYINEATDEVWRDIWQVITWADYKDLKGDAWFDERTKPIPIVKARKCINCGYYEGQHKADNCALEIYPEEKGDFGFDD